MELPNGITTVTVHVPAVRCVAFVRLQIRLHHMAGKAMTVDVISENQ